MSLLDVENLTVRFNTPDGIVKAVSDVSFTLGSNEILGIVGESGSGKSQLVLSIMGLLDTNGCAEGRVVFKNQQILNASEKVLNRIRGSRISMIFQDPMTSLNPYLRISRQMTEVLIQHKGMNYSSALLESIAMLDAVKIPDVKNRVRMYPHELSGGMRQRVMIAMALLCKPELIIADEPTTALDVTVQVQILQLLKDIQQEMNTTIIMITHDLGVIANICDHVLVLYAGQIMEVGSVRDIFYNPQHPYTVGLLRSVQRFDKHRSGCLETIPGEPPDLLFLPDACPFYKRCTSAIHVCCSIRPQLAEIMEGHKKACHVDLSCQH